MLRYERTPLNRIPVTIIACTGNKKGKSRLGYLRNLLDDNQCMDYLNDWDKEIQMFDVVDDYRSEKREVQRCQGTDFPFSFGDVNEN